MALTTDIAGSAPSALGSPSRIAMAGDRSQAFTVARRHSALVAALRIGLPVASVALCALYAIAIYRTGGWGEHHAAAPQPKIDPVNLTMDNPHYEGFNKDGGKYVVRADTAQQDLTQLGSFKLNGITGEFNQADKSRTDVTAAWGTYHNASSVLELYDKIEVKGSSGLKAHLKRATFATKEGTLTSPEPVEVELPTANVRANTMALEQKTRQILFGDGVSTRLSPQAKVKPPSDTPKPDAAGAGSKLFGGASRGPIDVESGELFIDDVGHVARFSGNVAATQADSSLSSPELQVTYLGRAAPIGSTPAGNAAPSGQSAVAAAGTGDPTAAKISTIVAQGPVVLTHAPGDKATADLLEFDAQTEVAVLTGNVVMTQAPDRRVTSDRAELDSKTEAALLTGAVNVMQGRNELHGRRLVVNHKSGRSQLSSPAEPGRGAARITSRFYRSEASASAAAKKAADTKPSEGITAFKTDPKAPIDIDAELLDVDDHAKVAVYRGGVHAVQGDMTIRSSDLTIRYAGNTGAANDPARQAGGAAQPGGAQLTRIEARGKVNIVSAKNGQTASGDWADCDMKANTCQLGGDVLLTQDKNIVRGTRLSIDMASGETRIVNDGPAKVPATPAPVAGAGGAEGAKRERPSALFYPKQQAAPQAKDQPAGAATSGWQSSTQPATAGSRKSGN